ncbi:MAG: winged helix-turn-helix transcriptional regulator [Actinomycetota bacterium]
MRGRRGAVGRQGGPHEALRHTLAQVGDRWSPLVVQALQGGPRRFVDLLEALEGIAPNILSDRLKRLEAAGVVSSSPYSERPVRLAYDLTGWGRDLAGALRLLAEWGARRTGEEAAVRHGACGTALETRWYCPTCARITEEGEGGELDFL